MSYICMIANQNGIAVSGDSRMSFQPLQLGLHIDRAQKVFSDPQHGLVWACCGLMVFAGVNYYKMTSYILRQYYRSMASRLNQISAVITRATAVQHALSRKHCAFTLLLGSVQNGQITVRALDIVDGKSTLRTLEAPILIQSGWEPSLHQPKPPVEDYANETLEQLVQRAKERCLWAVRRDSQLANEDRSHPQTVGGHVRVISLANPMAEAGKGVSLP